MRIEEVILTNKVTKNGIIYSDECLKSLQGKSLGIPVTVAFDKDRIIGVLSEAYYKDGKLIGVMELDRQQMLRNGVHFGQSVFRPAGMTPHHRIVDSEGNRVIDRLRMVIIGVVNPSIDVFRASSDKRHGKISFINHVKMFLNKFWRAKEKKHEKT